MSDNYIVLDTTGQQIIDAIRAGEIEGLIIEDEDEDDGACCLRAKTVNANFIEGHFPRGGYSFLWIYPPLDQQPAQLTRYGANDASSVLDPISEHFEASYFSEHEEEYQAFFGGDETEENSEIEEEFFDRD